MVKNIHEKMALALYRTFPLSFEEKFQEISEHVSEFIRLVQLDYSDQLIIPKIDNTTKGWFDFSRNPILNVEKILRSAFKNPSRKIFP